jgi:hypothetical protein
MLTITFQENVIKFLEIIMYKFLIHVYVYSTMSCDFYFKNPFDVMYISRNYLIHVEQFMGKNRTYRQIIGLMKGSANSPCSRYYTHSDYTKFRHLCQAMLSFEMMIVYDIASETFSSNYWANELYVLDLL